MDPRQYQIPFPPNRYSVAAATRTESSWGTIMPTPLTTAALSAPVDTQMAAENTRGMRKGRA